MNQLTQMQIYIPLGDDYGPEEENDWLSRVVLVDNIAGYIACPDCMADDRISDQEILDKSFDGDHTWAIESGNPANCILCKDTGKMWVSI